MSVDEYILSVPEHAKGSSTKLAEEPEKEMQRREDEDDNNLPATPKRNDSGSSLNEANVATPRSQPNETSPTKANATPGNDPLAPETPRKKVGCKSTSPYPLPAQR